MGGGQASRSEGGSPRARRHLEDLEARGTPGRKPPDKLAIQKTIKQTEASREEAWRAYDNEARTVEQAKDAIIDDVESRLAIHHTIRRVFTIRFTVT